MRRAIPLRPWGLALLLPAAACEPSPVGLILVDAPAVVASEQTATITLQVVNDDGGAGEDDATVDVFNLMPEAASLIARGSGEPHPRYLAVVSGPQRVGALRLDGVVAFDVRATSSTVARPMEVVAVLAEPAEADRSGALEVPVPALAIRFIAGGGAP